jgi:hypothetical protein
MWNAWKCLVGNLKGRDLLGYVERRCKDNIEMDVNAIGYEGMDCIQQASGSGSSEPGNDIFIRWKIISFSGRAVLYGIN